MANYLDYDGLEYYHNKVKASINNKVDKDGDKQLSTEDFTTEEKNKLAGITDGATAVSFEQTLASGTKIGSITINGNKTDVYAPAGDDSGGGVPSVSDYVHPTYTAHNLGFYKIKITNEGHVSEVSQVQKSDITALGIASTDLVSPSANGLMSKNDKSKLDGIAENATKVEFTQLQNSGTKIGTIKINNNSTDIYAPAGSNSGDSGGDSYTHPTYTAHNLGFYKVKVDNEGHVSEVAQVQKDDITDYGIASNDLVTSTQRGLMDPKDKQKLDRFEDPSHYALKDLVTSSANGLMSSKDKQKLDRFEDPSHYASTDLVTSSANGLMSSKDKQKLDRFEDPSHYATNDLVTSTQRGLMDPKDKQKLDRFEDPSHYALNNLASNSENGLMSKNDKSKLDGIASGATKVEFTQKQTSGTEIGTIKINGTATSIYAPSGGSGGDCNFTDADKAKLDGIAENANNYTLPTASSTLGGVKTTSTVTSTSGLTATPIINGIPYYKNTTYSAATTSANGLMSKTDKAKLDGVQDNATAVSFTQVQTSGTELGKITINGSETSIYAPADTYTLPTAGSTLGGVKTTSTVTSTSGLTACPIISGVPYYKNTNTTYSVATTSANGLLSKEDKTKLDGIAENANNYTLPTASSTLGGVKTTSTVTSTSGLTPSPIINGVPYYKNTNTTYSTASSSANGLLSKEDKAKLDGIESGANNYSHPTHAAKSAGMYKITVDGEGHVSAATAVAKADITALGIASNDVSSTSANGLMSSIDKTRVDNLYKYCLSVGTSLAAGTDLNDLTTIGKWYSGSAAVSAEIVNTPYTGGGFSLITMYTQSSTTNINQILLPNTTSTAYVMFKRKLATTGWGPWGRITAATATTALDGLLSKEDKAKLDSIEEGANNYELPTAGADLGGVKTTSTVTSTSGLTATPIINGVPYYKNTTYSTASPSANGLLSKNDKSKLDGISSEATKTEFSQTLSSGIELGKITINGSETSIYAPVGDDCDYTDAEKAKVSDLYDYTLTRGTALKAGDDLNDCIGIGRWYSVDSNLSKQLVNTPHTTTGFTLINVLVTGTTYFRQFLIPNTASTAYVLYSRHRSGSTWGSWGRVTGADATTSQSGLMTAAHVTKLNKIPEGIQDQVTDAVNVGAKNFLMNNFTTRTYRGVTATSNPDGSITLNGTNTSTSAFLISWNLQTGTTGSTEAQQYENNQKWIPTGKYLVSGGINSKAAIQVRFATEDNNNGSSVSAYGSDVALTITDAHKYVWVRIYIAGSASFDNEIIYPMIRPATVKDATYVPYAKSNAQLSYKKYYTATRETSSFNPAITTNLAALTPGTDIFVEMSYCASLSFEGNTDVALYTTLLDGSIVAKDIYIDNTIQLKLGLLHPGVWHLVYDGAKWMVADELPCVKYPYVMMGTDIYSNAFVATNESGKLVQLLTNSSKPFDPTQPIYFCVKGSTAATSGTIIPYAMFSKIKGIQLMLYGTMGSGQTLRNGPIYIRVTPSTTKGLWETNKSYGFYTDLSKVAAGGYYMKLLNRYDSLGYSFELTEDHPVFLVQSDIITRVL